MSFLFIFEKDNLELVLLSFRVVDYFPVSKNHLYGIKGHNLVSNYYRCYIKGGTYFFTLVTWERKKLLCKPETIQLLRESFRYAMQKHPFKIVGIVILPDHFHCILELPMNSDNFSLCLGLFKWYFSIHFRSVSNKRREKSIWQKRFWEHYIRDEEELGRCLDYIYYNPVKHGYVKNPMDWPYSSFWREILNGHYEKNWGNSELSIQNCDVMNE
jgi:putative transposase